MVTPEELLGGVTLAALVIYALTGGADYGGGVWDLLALGPRRDAQRALIAATLAPIWEANHVWLILVVVLLFTAFPPAFALLATALHIPLTLVLIGVVLRGSAFTFRSYASPDQERGASARRFGVVFAVASLITPLLLGVNLGALASGQVLMRDGVLVAGFVRPWLQPFPFAVGALALCLFAYLAAVYLCVEAQARGGAAALVEDFRRRALGSALVLAGVALLTLRLARAAAPLLYAGLMRRYPLHLVTLVVALGAVAALWRRRYGLARAAAAAQAALIIAGWGISQAPYLIVPTYTIYNAAAPPLTLRLLLYVLGLSLCVLVPSFIYLYRVFQPSHQRARATTAEPERLPRSTTAEPERLPRSTTAEPERLPRSTPL